MGVTRPRVTQLKSAGELTDLTEEGIDAYLKKKKAKEEERREYKQRQDDALRERHESILAELRTLNRNVLLLAAALGAKEAAGILSTIPR